MPVIYKITRTDGLEYIGIAISFKNRLATHRLSTRFSSGILESKILYEGTYQECWEKEEEYIKKYDTYNNGLNLTINGKGMNPKSTLGFKFSAESRRRMSEAKKNYIPWNVGKKYSMSEDVRARRKGKRCSSKLSIDDVKSIRAEYELRNDIELLSAVGTIAKNGIPITYEIAFINKHHKRYNLTTTGMKNILRRKSWADV